MTLLLKKVTALLLSGRLVPGIDQKVRGACTCNTLSHIARCKQSTNSLPGCVHIATWKKPDKLYNRAMYLLVCTAVMNLSKTILLVVYEMMITS